MKFQVFIHIFLLAVILISCDNHKHNAGNIYSTKRAINIKSPKKIRSDDTVGDGKRYAILKLDFQYGFKIKATDIEDLESFKTYSRVEIWHDNLRVFIDSSLEYEFIDKRYPTINNLKMGVYELLLEYNDRPLPDKLLFLRIENNKVVRKDKLPKFAENPKEIDGVLEYFGTLDDSEVLQIGKTIYYPYNPVLYYKVTADGIKLDSSLTIRKNTEKFGKFNGFHYNEKIFYPRDSKGNIDTAEKDIIRH